MSKSIDNLSKLVKRAIGGAVSAEPDSKRARFDPSVPVDNVDGTALKDEVEEVEFPPSIFDSDESKGPEILDIIAQRVNEAFTNKPLEDKMKPLQERYRSPANCQMMCVPRVNTPFWNELAASSTCSDLGMQEIQKMIVKTGQVLTTITDKVLLAKKQKEDIKPQELITPLSDALSFAGHARFLTSLKRRVLLKTQLSKKFQSLCSSSTPVTDWLFGDDLSKNVDDITKANKVATKITSNPHKGSYSNVTSTSSNQSKPRHFSGSRGGGSFRRRGPSSYYQKSNKSPERTQKRTNKHPDQH